jgi:RNA polymerase sigma-70 factor, ECF subfamily
VAGGALQLSQEFDGTVNTPRRVSPGSKNARAAYPHGSLKTGHLDDSRAWADPHVRLEVELLYRLATATGDVMAIYELKLTSVQRSSGADLANKASRVFRAQGRNSVSKFCRSAKLEQQNLAGLRAKELQSTAFQEMFEAYRPKFLALAGSIVRNKEDAEDAVHNAFLSAYLNLGNFEGRSALMTWFTRIVFNAALMIQRKRRSSCLVQNPGARTALELNWAEQIVSPRPDPEMVHGEKETLRLIDRHLSKMNPLLGQAFRMIHLEELSIQEASARLGLPSGTFKARLFRARRLLSNRVRRVQVAPLHRGKLPAGPGLSSFVEASPS